MRFRGVQGSTLASRSPIAASRASASAVGGSRGAQSQASTSASRAPIAAAGRPSGRELAASQAPGHGKERGGDDVEQRGRGGRRTER